MTNLPVTKRDLIIGAGAIIIGCISGVLYEKHAFERKFAEHVMQQITSQQQRLKESNDNFDQRFKASSERFSQTFEALKNNLKD